MRNHTAIHVEHKHAHHPLEFLFQRNISACRTFTKQSMKFLEKEVCDARGNVFSLFHSITLQLVQAPPLPEYKPHQLSSGESNCSDWGKTLALYAYYLAVIHIVMRTFISPNACLRSKRTWFVFHVNNPNRKVKYEQLLSTYNTESYDSVYPLVLPSASPSARTRVST